MLYLGVVSGTFTWKGLIRAPEKRGQETPFPAFLPLSQPVARVAWRTIISRAPLDSFLGFIPSLILPRGRPWRCSTCGIVSALYNSTHLFGIAGHFHDGSGAWLGPKSPSTTYMRGQNLRSPSSRQEVTQPGGSSSGIGIKLHRL